MRVTFAIAKEEKTYKYSNDPEINETFEELELKT